MINGLLFILFISIQNSNKKTKKKGVSKPLPPNVMSSLIGQKIYHESITEPLPFGVWKKHDSINTFAKL